MSRTYISAKEVESIHAVSTAPIYVCGTSNMNIRIIPRIDIKGPNLVKGVHFEGLRVLGKPESFARYYYEQGADELIYMDVVASLYGRNSLLEIIERTSQAIFIPLTVGGGLRSVDDIRSVLRAGADKVSLNTAAVRKPELIQSAARAFGSSTIVVSIEAKKKSGDTYEVYVDYGRERTKLNAFDWARRATELGAGELLITSIDQEGSGKGFDLELTRRIAEAVPIPVIAAGGAGRIEHVHEVIIAGSADAVCLASLLHYNAFRDNKLDEGAFKQEGNIEYLTSNEHYSRVEQTSLSQIKQSLISAGIGVRQLGKHA